MKNTNNGLKIAAFAFALISAVTLNSCSDDPEHGAIPSFTLDDVKGYTYETTFTSSSGTELNPAITVFNDERLDWNMSSTGMGNNQYYYTASADSETANVWTMYWYTAKSDMMRNNTAAAVMTVKYGINSETNVSVLVMSGTAGAGSSMAGTPLTMKRTDAAKNTTPTEIAVTGIEDVTITPSGSAADLPSSYATNYSGSFVYLVSAFGASGQGECMNGDTPSVEISGSGSSVKVKTPSLVYGTFEIGSIEISDVSVLKDGDVYYLSKGEFTATTDGKSSGETKQWEIAGTSVKGKIENGVLTLRVEFKPGLMPANIVQIFTSDSEE